MNLKFALSKLFLRKQSRTFSAIVQQFLNQPVWTQKNLTAFAKEGYCSNVYVYTCVRMIAQACSGIKWLVYRELNGRLEEVYDHQLNRLLKMANPRQSWNSLVLEVVSHLMISGNAYIESIMPRNGFVSELYVLRPDRMRVLPGNSVQPVAGYEYTVSGQKVRFGVDEILHLKLFNPLDDYYGMSPIEAVSYSIDQNNQARAWNVALLQNSSRPPGILKASGNLTEEQFERLKEQLAERYQGGRNAGRPIVLEGGLEWQETGYSPAEMEWLNGLKLTAREIAIAFGVPTQLLGEREVSTYSNYREARKAFYTETVLPLMDYLKEAFNSFLIPKFADESLRLDYDRDDIEALSEDRAEVWKQSVEAVKAGILTPNEARELLGYSKLEGADSLFMHASMMPYTGSSEE